MEVASPGRGKQETILRIRSHAAAFAGDLLRLRQALPELGGAAGFSEAVEAFADGLAKLTRLAIDIERDALRPAPADPGAHAGDLVDGELVAFPPHR